MPGVRSVEKGFLKLENPRYDLMERLVLASPRDAVDGSATETGDEPVKNGRWDERANARGYSGCQHSVDRRNRCVRFVPTGHDYKPGGRGGVTGRESGLPLQKSPIESSKTVAHLRGRSVCRGQMDTCEFRWTVRRIKSATVENIDHRW